MGNKLLSHTVSSQSKKGFVKRLGQGTLGDKLLSHTVSSQSKIMIL